MYDSRGECNAIIETESNTLIAGCASTIIPESIDSIEGYAFCFCSGLTEINIPDCVTAYGGKIAVVNGKEITVYSSSGKVTRTVETEKSVSEIFCCSGEIYTVESGVLHKY